MDYFFVDELKYRLAAATRMAQLRRIETQVTAELTAAESALAAARARSAAASVTSARVGAGLLGVLGGPVGLGLTVAGVAATYLLMSDNADKANKKLEEQAAVANRTASELNKLMGVERKSAINDLTAAFEAQNKEVRKSELAVGSALIKIQNYAIGNAEVARISNAARLGTISYTDAVKQLNSMEISPDLYNALKKQVEKYDEYIKYGKEKDFISDFWKARLYTPAAIVDSDKIYEEIKQRAMVDKLKFPPMWKKVNDVLAGGVNYGLTPKIRFWIVLGSLFLPRSVSPQRLQEGEGLPWCSIRGSFPSEPVLS